MKEWDVRSPAMTGYCNAVRKLEKKFEGLELHHIPRLKNQAADDLAKIGSKREAIPSNVFLGHIHTPSVQEDPFTEGVWMCPKNTLLGMASLLEPIFAKSSAA